MSQVQISISFRAASFVSRMMAQSQVEHDGAFAEIFDEIEAAIGAGVAEMMEAE